MITIMNSVGFRQFCYDIFDKLPIAIDIVDKDGNILYMNRCFLNFLKLKEEDVLGRYVGEINYNSRFPEVLKNKKAEIAWGHKFENGKEAIVHRLPIIDDNGDIIGGFGMVLFENIKEVRDILDKFQHLDTELKKYKSTIAKLNCAKYTLLDIIGESDAVTKCKVKTKKIARVNSNIFIHGESGVGKELFAHSVHNESNRKDKPFVSINCSAIPENLIESELFGYEEGAFTGAKKGGNVGKFQLAQGGTIFLDEIGEMPLYLQAKLLRVIQEKEVYPIGANAPVKIDVRVVSASHKNLMQLVDKGQFREDLYYRLNVLNLNIPSLRERKEDIKLLSEDFLNKFYKETGMYRNIPKNVMDILKKYEWPGNVRELFNVLEKLCVNSEDVNVSIHDIPSAIINKALAKEHKIKNNKLKDILSSVEKDIIIETLKECNHNKSEVAKKLGIPRVSLYRKLEEYEIEYKY